MFVDQATIYVKAGDGGRGANSFYRDRFNRQGTPDGGGGGRGADIVIRADRNLQTLLDFQYQRHFRGRQGAHGSGKRKKGRDELPLTLRVPLGTAVRDKKSVCLLRELVRDGEAFIVARGGKGGLGNSWRKQATDGEAGQERELLLDLRLIADVGLLGFPNAGKSTFITAVSNARPKIAAYPFTTKFPTLGRVQAAGKDFVIADIPGLIAGSAQGRGLGDRFLRHIERTRLILHIIDMAGSEGRDPLQDYRIINQELKAYSRQLLKKPQFIAANKMDLETAEANLLRFKRNIAKKIYPISALKKDGLEVLLEAIAAKL